MSQEDMLPEGWANVRLGDGIVTDVQPGFACGANNREGQGMAHLRPMNVNEEGHIDLKILKFIREPEVDRDERLVKQGDVIFNNTNSPELVGKTAYYSLPEPRAFSNHMTRLRCRSDTLDPLFCTMVLHQKWREGYFQTVSNNHVSQSSVSRAVLLDTPILLPPLPEQKRIVEKVEELLARNNAARVRLAKVPLILKRLHQVVLAAACSGRLTADWRSSQKELEPADQLVERIRGTYRKQYEAECNKAKREGKRLQRKPEILELSKVETADLPEIPDEWTWVYLPALGYMSRGKSKHRPRNAPHLYGGPYPFIQTGDIAQSQGLITSHRQTYSEAGLAQSQLWPAGTICITIAANIANSAILTYPACFPDSVVGLISDETLCLKEYAEFFIRTARANLDQFAPATAQKNINIEILRDVAVPLPPLTEQKEIVSQVESMFKLVDTVERRVEAATTRAEKLTQAILAKAFRGELVPLEAELARRDGRPYETASELLARIKSEHKLKEIEKRSYRRPKSGRGS